MGIRDQLLAAVRKSRLSERRLSMEATGSSDTLRNIRRGAHPRVNTLEAICRVLGLKVQLAPGLVPPTEDDVVAVHPPTVFTEALELPVYEWTDRSEEGYLRRSNDRDRAPAPVDMPDEQAFYLRVPDGSMVRARIAQGDYCLVSPFAALEVDQRAWFRHPTGRETIWWIMRLSVAGFDLGAWYLGERNDPRPTRVHWKRDEVVDRGVVLDVYKERPTVKKRLQPRPDWRPDARAELFRAGLCSDELSTVSEVLDEAVSVMEEAEVQIKRLAGTGATSDSHAELILRVLDESLDNSLRRTRSSVIEHRSYTNAGTSRP